MTYNKMNWKVLVLVVIVFIFNNVLFAGNDYQIVAFTGKVKIKQNGKVSLLKTQLPLNLKNGDAIMVYPNATIRVQIPGRVEKVFTGPFYATIESLTKPQEKESLSFWAQNNQWQRVERIFDEEGNESSGTTKGTQEDSLNFFGEINPVVNTVKIEDTNNAPDKKMEMEKLLATQEVWFNAFPEEKKVVIRALIYKNYGWYKKALDLIFSHYKGILQVKEKQRERELLEDYLFAEFIPIVITSPSEKGFAPDQALNFQFGANIKVWWSAFLFDGVNLTNIKNTVDTSLHPQNSFNIDKKSVVNRSGNKSTTLSKPICLFIVVCADWKELAKFDDKEYARKELLGNSIPENRSQSIQNYSRVIFKLGL